MSTFREFEHAGWEDPRTCTAYRDHLGPVVAQVVEPLLDAVEVRTAGRVVDVATGAGTVAAAAARRGASAIGLDFSAEQLRRARADHPAIAVARADAGAPARLVERRCRGQQLRYAALPGSRGVPAGVRAGATPGGAPGVTVWAPPDRSPTFAAVFAALAHHGTMNVGLPPGPDFFRYADPAAASRDLTEAGFADVSVIEVTQTWELPSPDDAVDALLHGTVRTAALLSRQPAGVLAEVRRAMRERLAAYDEGVAVRVPMPAVVVRATRP